VTISIDRGDEFNEAVTLTFTAPAGIKVNPPEAEVAEGIDEVDVTLSVPPTAQAGEHTINVTATPASGQNPVSHSFKIEVEAAEDEGGARQPATDTQPPANTQPTQP
jgi:uncharacterized membrane protein